MQHVPPKKSIKNAFEYCLENIFSMEIWKNNKNHMIHFTVNNSLFIEILLHCCEGCHKKYV